MRLLLIDDDTARALEARDRLAAVHPGTEILVRDPAREGPLPPEALAIGFDAVLLADGAAQGRARGWAAELAARPGFAPVWLIGESAAALQARGATASTPPALRCVGRAQLGEAAFAAALAQDCERQSLRRALWRSGEAGRETQSFGGVFIRGYRNVRRLARGRHSDLYLAESERMLDLLALKVARDVRGERDIDDSFRRFLQEYEIVQRIQSAGVVRLYDLGVSDEHAWLVMEYFACGDLRTRMRAGVSPPEALRFAVRIAEGLAAIHAAGVLHRDLKPGNVMLRADGSIALIDFGLSKDAALELDVTDHGTIFGTPHYMSPEQGHGEPVDVRSDLYSLGVILFEMLAGRKPYTAENPMAIIYQHRKAPIPALPERLAALTPLLERLLAKEPAGRFASATAAAEALERARRALAQRVPA